MTQSKHILKPCLFFLLLVSMNSSAVDLACINEAQSYIDSRILSEENQVSAVNGLKTCLTKNSVSESEVTVSQLGDMWSQPVYTVTINPGSSPYYCLETKCPELKIEQGNPLWQEIQKSLPDELRNQYSKENLIAVPKSLMKEGIFIPKSYLKADDGQKIIMEINKPYLFDNAINMNNSQIRN